MCLAASLPLPWRLQDWGYWALVAKPIVTSGLAAVGVWMSCPWVPGRPRFTPEVKELVGFGVGVTGFTMTDYLTKSADRVAVGYFYGAGPLGYFQNAFLLYSNLLSHSHGVFAQHSGIRPEQAQGQRRRAQAIVGRGTVVGELCFYSDICGARRYRTGFRGAIAGAEMGTCGSPAMHFCRERHRP